MFPTLKKFWRSWYTQSLIDLALYFHPFQLSHQLLNCLNLSESPSSFHCYGISKHPQWSRMIDYTRDYRSIRPYYLSHYRNFVVKIVIDLFTHSVFYNVMPVDCYNNKINKLAKPVHNAGEIKLVVIKIVYICKHI